MKFFFPTLLSLACCSPSSGIDGGLPDGGSTFVDSGTTPGDGGQTIADGGAFITDGGTNIGDAFAVGPLGCDPMTFEPNVNLSDYFSDRYGWSDGFCRKRTAALVRNNAADPGGSNGGYLRTLTWSSATNNYTSTGTNSNEWNGWGYVVNHYAKTSGLSKYVQGTFKTVLAGTHHSIHEFKLKMTLGGATPATGEVDVTIWWSFATGRSAPIYAIRFEIDPLKTAANIIRADTRSPYGTLAFEGTQGEIGGIGWGDKYHFTTTGAGPVSWNTPWDYTKPNTVPYVRMWSRTVDAEMGAVQTESFDQHVAGGDYGGGLLGDQCWGKTSANKGADCSEAGQSLPHGWLWPYQLNQYELGDTALSHRMAWGSNYGAIGNASVTAFGKTFSGYPMVSYAVLLTVGEHSKNTTLEAAKNIEHSVGAQLSSTVGSSPQWNPTFASWDVSATSNQATVSLNPQAGSISAPTFRFLNYSPSIVTQVTLNGHVLTADADYFATVDSATQTLWLTLHGTVKHPIVLHVE